ncbi:TROVE domain-containing protein [Paenibacillus mucilaginosus]|uniref:TROVE domain-containing protein n=1 Tax=Paenibacillus mucilaginosus (strain KNP414) TaxID=1036673 RepID=F8FM34_PAEMK|nr:TROVE domain-containing protein [Paenibacillus mucilaginosus]AEI45660.1 TROVE domain-containing protein [Paenibacillus mucilaginosus KNP414]MCG7215145.1 TROVE domain-containing protein [Paenibacillus mucilaginosus]WDM27057.1 TROVE domain-containing protein [Paenibacillus mucilaginosus]
MSHARKLFGRTRPHTYNHEGYAVHTRSLEEQYLQTLLTNTMGGTFYADGGELLEDAHRMHREMAQHDPQFMARALVFARSEGFMRLQPLYGLAVLSGIRPDLFARAFHGVVRIPSDLADFLTILRGLGRGQGGRAVKRQVNRFLSGVTEYWALKYNGRGRGYSLGDAIATAHPKPADEKQRTLFRYLRGKETDLSLLPQIAALEELKRAGSEAEQLHWIGEGRLPYETVTGAIQPTRAIWEALLYQMPQFALLRHLNALDRSGVFGSPEHLRYAVGRLTDREALERSRILPFRFAAAFRQVGHPELRDALRAAVDHTFDALPDLPGRTAVFLDISGSMNGEYLQTGSVFALALYKKTQGASIFWLFDTEVVDPRPSRYDSILGQAEQIHTRGGTDTGSPVRRLTREKQHVDRIIIITDEQQNSGSPFYRDLQAYRAKVNPEAQAFIVDIAPYRHAMVPPEDPRTFYIYGWSDTVLSYIAQASQGYGSMVERVATMEWEEENTG